MDRQDRSHLYSRREFGKLALAAVPAVAILTDSKLLFAQAKPNSVFGGVRIGVITPYSFNVETPDVQAILAAVTKVGASEIEIQVGHVEAFAGAPAPPARQGGPAPAPAAAAPGQPAARQGGGGGRANQTPEQLAAAKAYAAKLSAWRVSAPMTKFEQLRKMFNDAGVKIDAYRITLTEDMPDAEYDYAFNAARAMGADQVTMELPGIGGDRHNINLNLTKRVGSFAAKHKIAAGYHAHQQATPTLWDAALAQTPWNKAQVDIGHYTGSPDGGPSAVLATIQKHHAQIASLHLKDRKTFAAGAANVSWGQGNTPIKEVLQLMKKQRYTFPAFIELEYPVPAGSTRVAEVAKCLQYAKDALA